MPRHPQTTALTDSIRGSVFSALAHRLDGFPGETYPFHVGDSWLEPPPGCRGEDRDAGWNRYVAPSGHTPLIDLLVERVRERTGVAIERANVYPTAGATGGLSTVTRVLLAPADEVLLLAPYWPLIEGIVRSCPAVPVPVPLLGEGGTCSGADDLIDRLERAATPRTAAVYLGTPNNPSGRVRPPTWVEALVRWATARHLWILSDDVYEEFSYTVPFQSCLPLAPERTITVHSCSKAYAMAGHRTGWVIGPRQVLDAARKVGTHTFYSTPTYGQLAAARALANGADWLRDAAARYRRAGDDTARELGIEPPQGGTFLFLDLTPLLGVDGLLGFLEDCAEHGLLLAPGPSFGPYPTWARLCFTAVDPERTARGVAVLRRVIEKRRARGPAEARGAEARSAAVEAR